MRTQVNMDKIARGLRAVRGGKVTAGGGYFGAVQLAAEVADRLRVPVGGGRATDPRWTERRLVPLTPVTLERLEKLASLIRARTDTNIEPMQLAAILLEKSVVEARAEDPESLVRISAQGDGA